MVAVGSFASSWELGVCVCVCVYCSDYIETNDGFMSFLWGFFLCQSKRWCLCVLLTQKLHKQWNTCGIQFQQNAPSCTRASKVAFCFWFWFLVFLWHIETQEPKRSSFYTSPTLDPERDYLECIGIIFDAFFSRIREVDQHLEQMLVRWNE